MARSLRVLVVGEVGGWFEAHIVGSFRDMGHEVTFFSPGPYLGEFYGWSRARVRRDRNLKLVALARRLLAGRGLDLIFCCVFDDFLEVETAEELASLGVPLVNYNVDMVNQWYRQTRTARHFTLMCCAQRANMEHLRRYAREVMYLPMAARPALLDQQWDAPERLGSAVVFVGFRTLHRERTLARLAGAGLPLVVYGSGWVQGDAAPGLARPNARRVEKLASDLWHYLIPKYRAEGLAGLLSAALAGRGRRGPGAGIPPASAAGRLPDEALGTVFRRSAVNIGFSRIVEPTPFRKARTQVKLRHFEVPAAGGFFLVEDTEEYHELFEPGTEVETWRTLDELVEKCRRYLRDNVARQAIAQAGYRRARAEHCWEHRFSKLLRHLDLWNSCGR